MKNSLRDYDPITETLSFQGERISLRELSNSLDDLGRKVEAALNRTTAPVAHPVLSEPGNARFARM